MENLETRVIGQRVLYFPSLASTMDMAKQEARQGANEGTVIVAGAQNTARGRLQRAWISPAGNVALSLVLYPRQEHLSSLIMLASLAVVHCIRTVTVLKPQIKWPNDVLINGKKVCGILIESDVRADTVNHVIIGIGINVNLRTADFPEIQTTATSLSQELGREVSCLNVVRALLEETDKLYLALSAGESLYEEWRDNLVTLGQAVRVTAGQIIYEGVAESVAHDGSLTIRDAKGQPVTIVVGDVTLRS
ncbi:MAG: biotin--[acetyl-CoA-carboxylase] ligase [Chloroflexi bacterium]|nr:biotin--[acetyl-CoA-carboxylase] ligase [Chloroflexota bacterium]